MRLMFLWKRNKSMPDGTSQGLLLIIITGPELCISNACSRRLCVSLCMIQWFMTWTTLRPPTDRPAAVIVIMTWRPTDGDRQRTAWDLRRPTRLLTPAPQLTTPSSI